MKDWMRPIILIVIIGVVISVFVSLGNDNVDLSPKGSSRVKSISALDLVNMASTGQPSNSPNTPFFSVQLTKQTNSLP